MTPPPHSIKTPSDTVNADGSRGTGGERQRGKMQDLGVKKGNQELQTLKLSDADFALERNEAEHMHGSRNGNGAD